MARRIALVVVALIALLLGSVAVPLGLLTAGQDRRDFRDEAFAAASAVVGVAEEHLDDHTTGRPLARAVLELERRGDAVAVYDSSGRLVAGVPAIPGISAGAIRRVVRVPRTRSYPIPGRLVVVMAVTDDSGHGVVGVVVLSRSAAAIDHRIAELWAWLAAVSAAGLLAAGFIATALARWVARPLGALSSAAQRLGSGDFEARSPARSGPPEVRRLSASFNQMAARLEALVGGHQAMMADVSHQLRTPLAALRLRLDVLAQEAPAHIGDELAGAQEEIARLSRMVDGLLAVARAQSVTAAQVPVQVESVIRDRSAAWRPAAEEKAVDLSASAAGPLTARMGEGHLEQILDNLLANALEAVPAGGHVTVSAGPADGRVQIIVADDGPGMPADQRRAAFRRFVSATPGGTGLGLAIVHRLATTDGGSAELSDTPGGGLTVTIDVPAVPRERQARRSGGAHPASHRS